MSVSPLVLKILAACWMLPALIVAVKFALERHRDAHGTSATEMDVALHDVDVRLTSSTVSGSGEAWGDASSQTYVGSANPRVSTSVRHVTVQAPYAEISVPVYDGNGDVCVRRCSLCVN